MKTCTKCNKTKEEDAFEMRGTKRRNQCRTCMNKTKRAHYLKNPLDYKFREAQRRAKKRGLEFDITIDDIVIPDYCPLLGMKLEVNTQGAQYNSPSLDRIDSSRGYTKDNIWVISHRANTVKNDASLEELINLVYNLKTKIEKCITYRETTDEGFSSGHRDELNHKLDLVLRN